MKLIETTLVHKAIFPKKESVDRHPALILLHGRGANESDLLGLGDQLDSRLLIISPRAPYPFEWGGGFTWYDIKGVGKPEPAMHVESYRRLIQFIDDVTKAYPIDPSRIYLLGFSMGTMMSYTLGLSRPELFAGVIANSGYIPEQTEMEYSLKRLNQLSFFVSHGVHDPVIPVQAGRRALELLRETDARVEYHEYSMGHEINGESLSDMSNWLTGRLNSQ